MRKPIVATSILAALAGVSWMLFASQRSQRPPAGKPQAVMVKQESLDAPPKTVVLELFTSQGCSSCPPADRLLTELGDESFGDGIIVPLALHVDYWNYIGWSDPFSSSEWSARQHDYARAMKAAQVYTPQLVLDGRKHLVGSSEMTVRTEIARQLKENDRTRVELESFEQHADEIKVNVRVVHEQELSTKGLVLRVVLFENELTTPVRRGENSGRTLRNDHVIRWMSKPLPLAGASPAESHRVIVPARNDWVRSNIGVAAIVQDPSTLEISGAAIRQPENDS